MSSCSVVRRRLPGEISLAASRGTDVFPVVSMGSNPTLAVPLAVDVSPDGQAPGLARNKWVAKKQKVAVSSLFFIQNNNPPIYIWCDVADLSKDDRRFAFRHGRTPARFKLYGCTTPRHIDPSHTFSTQLETGLEIYSVLRFCQRDLGHCSGLYIHENLFPRAPDSYVFPTTSPTLLEMLLYPKHHRGDVSCCSCSA
jgi:hypothetical protein